jgi:hypothetical protein
VFGLISLAKFVAFIEFHYMVFLTYQEEDDDDDDDQLGEDGEDDDPDFKPPEEVSVAAVNRQFTNLNCAILTNVLGFFLESSRVQTTVKKLSKL